MPRLLFSPRRPSADCGLPAFDRHPLLGDHAIRMAHLLLPRGDVHVPRLIGGCATAGVTRAEQVRHSCPLHRPGTGAPDPGIGFLSPTPTGTSAVQASGATLAGLPTLMSTDDHERRGGLRGARVRIAPRPPDAPPASGEHVPLTGSQVALLMLGPGGRIQWASAAARSMMTGLGPDGEGHDLEGRCLDDLVVDTTSLNDAIRRLEARKPAPPCAVRIRCADGSYRDLIATMEAVQAGGAASYVCFLVDVTHREERESRLLEMALQDPVSGLPNRRALMSTLRRLLRSRDGEPFALALVDGDHLKVVNDTFGHQVGDDLIRQLGQRLRGSCRTSDLVARIGGDEFAVVLRGVASIDAAMELLSRIQAKASESYRIGSHVVSCSVSIGLALSGDHRGSARRLLEEADVALARAKALGRGRCETALGRRGSAAVAGSGSRTDQEIADVVARGDLVLHFQPIVELSSRRVAGFEAMLRMRGTQGRLVAAHEFLSIAEASGRMEEIGWWELRQACRFLGTWQDRLLPDRRPFMTCNVPARLLEHERLPDLLGQWLEESAVAPGTLWLELTEAMLVRRPVIARLKELASRGIRLAIDDFGTGFTSLARLEQLPLTALKIDGSLVRRLEGKGADPGVLRGVIALAHDLGMSAVAECVETPRQEEALTRLECDMAQGFGVARPVGAEIIEKLLATMLLPPLPAGAADADSVSVGPPAAPLRERLSVLIVEDDADSRELIAEFLKRSGYDASVASDGEEALALLGTGAKPRVILLDLRLPRVDGWTFRARQRQDPRLAHVPVVVLSGTSDVIREAAALEAADALSKPVDLSRLAATLRRVASPPYVQ